jgi:adenine phosphoribosyltransferase
MNLKSFIRETPNFPKQGILFRDFTPLLSDSKTLSYIASNLIKDLNLNNIDYFAGIESRGFILATLMASFHQKGFIPIRKAGKLPPPVHYESYDLEYGSATLEMHQGSGKIVIIDDVLATGGTLQAAINVSQKAGYIVVDVRTLINLKFLNNFSFNSNTPFSLIEYES